MRKGLISLYIVGESLKGVGERCLAPNRGGTDGDQRKEGRVG